MGVVRQCFYVSEKMGGHWLPHQRSVVCEIYEGGKVKDGDHKEQIFWDIVFDNGRAPKNLGPIMGRLGEYRGGVCYGRLVSLSL